MPLLRERQEGFRKQSQLLDPESQLVRFRAEKMTGNTDQIAHVQELKELVSLFPNNVELDVDLQPLALPLDVRKTSLPVKTNGHDPPGESCLNMGSFQLVRGVLPIFFNNFRRCLLPFELMRVRVKTKGGNLFEFFLPLEKLVARLELQWFGFQAKSFLRIVRQYSGGILSASRKARVSLGHV